MTSRQLATAGIAALLTWTVAMVAFLVNPAGSELQPEMRVGVGTPTTMEGGPLETSAALTGLADARQVEEMLRDPAACSQATWCDTVPVVFDVPEVDISDDVLVTIVLDWEHPDETLAEEGVPDLDFYFWDDGQRKTEVEPATSAYTQLAASASGDPIETIRFLNPDLDRYNLTVLSWAGTATSYDITATMVVAEFTSPFELLEPDAPVAIRDEPPKQLESPSPTLPKPGQPDVAPRPSLDPIDLDLDESLDIDAPSLEDQLAAPEFQFEPAADAPPADVSTAALLATLLAVPVAGAVGGASFMIHRRRAYASV